MKTIYILIVLVVVTLNLGCVGNKQEGAKPQVPPAETSSDAIAPTIPSQAPAPTDGEDLFGIEGDIAAMDSMLNDSSLDTTLSTSI